MKFWMYVLLVLNFAGIIEKVHSEPQLPDSIEVLLTNNNKLDDQRMATLMSAIDFMLKNKNVDESLNYIDEFGSMAKLLNVDYYDALSDYFRGSYYAMKSDYKNAIIKLTIAQNKFALLTNENLTLMYLIKIKVAMSGCYCNSMMLLEAYNEVQKGLEYNKKLKSAEYEFKMNNNLAVIFSEMGKIVESNKVYRKMLNTPGITNEDYVFYQCNMIDNYLLQNMPDSALYYLRQIDGKSAENQLLVLVQTAEAYRLDNNLGEAINYYRSAMAEPSIHELSNRRLFTSILVNLAEIYNQLNKLDSALIYVKKGLNCGKESYLVYQKEAMHIRTEIFQKQGKYKQAFESLKEENSISDSIVASKNLNQLNQIIMQQEVSNLENDFQQQKILTELEHTKEKISFWFFIFLLAMVIVVVFTILKRKQNILKNKQVEEERLSQELELRNRELANNVINNMRKNEAFANIISKLDAIKEKTDDSALQGDLSKLAKDVEKNIDKGFWDEFETRFRQVNTSFYDELIKKFPTLTRSEVRLCIFLKLNFSTKDISAVTGQTTLSIDKARYRMRKKMGVDEFASLYRFITSIG